MDVDEGESEIDVFASELDEEERCVACGETIPFSRLSTGTCRNGHAWGEFTTSYTVYESYCLPLQSAAASVLPLCSPPMLGLALSAIGKRKCRSRALRKAIALTVRT